MVTDRSFSRTIGMSTFDLSLQSFSFLFFSLFFSPVYPVYRTEEGKVARCERVWKEFIILNRNLAMYVKECIILPLKRAGEIVEIIPFKPLFDSSRYLDRLPRYKDSKFS